MQEYDLEYPDAPPSLHIVERIAAAKQVDPSELDPPLYHSVAPSALDRLVDHHGTLDRITFHYQGYDVTVDADGNIELN